MLATQTPFYCGGLILSDILVLETLRIGTMLCDAVHGMLKSGIERV